ncbi:MAG TPA: DoxX family protein [Candidatus Angelobacter sp.]|nr:DoxX family protein [Candidatus Angelobacter sp.]
MSFTAYAELRLPQVAEAFTHLGFPAYFRVELSWAKLLGVVLLLAPMPPTPASPSTSPRLSSPTSRWAMARRRGALRRPPACSGGSRISSGVAICGFSARFDRNLATRTGRNRARCHHFPEQVVDTRLVARPLTFEPRDDVRI